MLTGDNRVTAEAVTRKLGIDRIEAEVLSEQKSPIVKQLQVQGRTWRWRATASSRRRR